MKVALVHDWLIHMRGGEKVLEALAEVFPDATIYTLFSNRKKLSPPLQRMKIKNSILHYFPGIRIYYRWLLPLLPFFVRTLNVAEADLVISSSHCVAKGARIPRGAKHVCYCHTPMRYLWGFEEDYFGNFPKWLRAFLNPVFDRIRKWDVETSAQVDAFLCNSEHVKKRIRAIYAREAEVIPPPVDFSVFEPVIARTAAGGGWTKQSAITEIASPLSLTASVTRTRNDEPYYLIVSALTPYKRIDVAIQAFNDWNRSLIIAGDGPSRRQYQRLAKTPNIRFLGKVSDEDLKHLYSKARALIFPQEEDFGIVPLEAQACGTPVIALARGGALETLEDGIFFEEQTPEAVREAVLRCETRSFEPEKLRRHALKFDKPLFKAKIKQAIDHVIHST